MLSPRSCQSPQSVVRVCTYSGCDVVSAFSCDQPGHGKAHCLLSESTRMVATILWEDSHDIAQVLSEPTGKCQSAQVYWP